MLKIFLNRDHLESKKGFTLIELSVVISIMGILAALAVPNFMRFIEKAKETEARTNLPLIYALQMKHKLHNGSFFSCPPNPPNIPEQKSKWQDDPDWERLGFDDLIETYFQYEVVSDSNSFTAYARRKGDLDQVKIFKISSLKADIVLEERGRRRSEASRGNLIL
ncbi:MAG: type II secretion system protein [bacterium]